MKKMLVILVAACFFVACNNDTETKETKEPVPDTNISTDSPASMPDNTIQLQDTLNRRPHQ